MSALSDRTEFTKEQRLKEILKCKLDPLYFISNYVTIELPGGSDKFHMYEKQKRLIKSILEDKYLVVLKSRQIGISTVIQAFCVYLICFYPNLTIGVISRDGSESTDFTRKCKMILSGVPSWMRPRFIKKTEQTFELSNRSRMVSSQVNLSNPSAVFRGKTITFLVIDEAAFIRKIEEAFIGLSPTVFNAHKVAKAKQIPYGIVVVSTPNGTVGTGKWFYDLYTSATVGESIFKPFTVHYSEAPFVTEEWVNRQKEILISSKGQKSVDQELELKFTSPDESFLPDQVFSRLQETLESKIEYTTKKGVTYEWTFYDEVTPDDFYLVGVDIATQFGECNSSIIVCQYPSLKQVAELTAKMKISELEQEIINLARSIRCLIIPESNSYSTQLVERLSYIIPDKLYFQKKKLGNKLVIKPGHYTDSVTRPLILNSVYSIITSRPETVRSKNLALELMNLDKRGRGKRTDRVMAFGLICYIAEHDPESIFTCSDYQESGITPEENPFFVEERSTIYDRLLSNEITLDEYIDEIRDTNDIDSLTDDELDERIFL